MLFFLLLLYLTVLYVRPGEMVPGLAGVPILPVLSGVASVVALASLLTQRRHVRWLPQDLSVIGFWFAIIVSNAAWGWFGGAYAGGVKFLPVVFGYFLIRVAISSASQLRWAAGCLVALTVFLSVNGVVQRYTGTAFGSARAVTQRVAAESAETGAAVLSRTQGTGIFGDPNDLAMALVIALPFIFGLLLRPAGALRSRLTGVTLLAPVAMCLVYTGSRGGMLGACAAASVYAHRRFGRLLAVLVLGAIVVGLLAVGPSRFQQVDSQEESARGRLEAWSQGLTLLKARPLCGVGYGRFTEFNELVAHNSFVHSLGETGLLGGFFFVSLFYWSVRGLFTGGEGVQGEWRDMQGRLVAALAGLATTAFFLSRQYSPVPFIVFGLVASFAELSPRQPVWSMRSTGAIVAWLLVGVLVVKAGIMILLRAT